MINKMTGIGWLSTISRLSSKSFL